MRVAKAPSSEAQMALYEDAAQAMPLTRKAGVFANYAGGLVSLGLMVGVGVWGYQLIMRDVTGIPVVRAMEGDMRVAPENPGGEVALHTGLSVNAVAAEGEAAAPEDTLMLAPATAGLAAEDLEVQPHAEADEVVPLDDATPDTAVAAVVTDGEALAAPTQPLSADDILALADQIASGATPLSDLAAGENVAPTIALDGVVVEPAVAIISRDVPGVVTSIRPTIRPARAVAAVTNTSAVAAALAEATQVSLTRETLPTGTKLVQLGAYPSAENAATAWTSLQGRFGDYMTGKDRVIQEASSGGRTFYRLRAMGFDDLADARRFCAALDAGNADCIPVVVR